MSAGPNQPPVATALSVEQKYGAFADRIGALAQDNGVTAGMPLHPFVEGMQELMRDVGRERGQGNRELLSAVGSLKAVLDAGTATAEAVSDSHDAEIRLLRTRAVKDLVGEITKTASGQVVSLARAAGRFSALIVAGAVVLAIALGSGAGWYVGRQGALTSIAETEEMLRLAFRDGPDRARMWANLMRDNDVAGSLAICREPGETSLQGGQRTCRVPLWLEPRPSAKRF